MYVENENKLENGGWQDDVGYWSILEENGEANRQLVTEKCSQNCLASKQKEMGAHCGRQSRSPSVECAETEEIGVLHRVLGNPCTLEKVVDWYMYERMDGREDEIGIPTQ